MTALLDLLHHQPALFIAASAIFGLCCGSFLNVVIHRMPKIMEQEWRRHCADLTGQEVEAAPPYNLLVPASTCPICGHTIRAWENIPLLSYAWLRGRCSACGSLISIRYPLVEAISGLFAGLLAWQFGPSWSALAAMLFVFAMVALTFIDFETYLLPDDITLPLLWLGLLVNLGGVFTDLQSAVVGAMAGYIALWAVYWLFFLATGKEGMGQGDFKLLAAIGAWFGWQLLPAVVLLASVLGASVGIVLILLYRHGRNTPIPFGPYLALGGIAALFFGPALARLYLP